jgi:hypothetical protein
MRSMSAPSEMFDGVNAMSLAQLLSAFVACIGYALAQGAMLNSRGRLVSLFAMLLGIAAFALQGTDWVRTVILTAFAIVGFGSFVAVVWLMSRVLGVDSATAEVFDAPAARTPNDTAPAIAGAGRPRISSPVAST